MQTEATTGIIVAPATDMAPIDEGFGTRPSAHRPHSMNLFGNGDDGSRDIGSRAMDLLVGVGIGAAVMYYLSSERGSRGRETMRFLLREVLGVVGPALLGSGAAAHSPPTRRTGSQVVSEPISR